jgi:hypothetical protein
LGAKLWIAAVRAICALAARCVKAVNAYLIGVGIKNTNNFCYLRQHRSGGGIRCGGQRYAARKNGG